MFLLSNKVFHSKIEVLFYFIFKKRAPKTQRTCVDILCSLYQRQRTHTHRIISFMENFFDPDERRVSNTTFLITKLGLQHREGGSHSLWIKFFKGAVDIIVLCI